MTPRIDKYGFTKYEDILHFADKVFRSIEECLQNNLYQDCVLQINPKTYEYSVCKSSEAIPVMMFIRYPTWHIRMLSERCIVITKSFTKS